MKTRKLRPLALATLCLASAFALAVTSKPCEPQEPTKCTGQGNGAQCGGGNIITISEPVAMAHYYCGGNSASRCADGDAGKCSELLYVMGTASEIKCGSTSLGWCGVLGYTGTPQSTGYDCGQQPCPDVTNPTAPNIVGHMAQCGVQVGPYIMTNFEPL